MKDLKKLETILAKNLGPDIEPEVEVNAEGGFSEKMLEKILHEKSERIKKAMVIKHAQNNNRELFINVDGQSDSAFFEDDADASWAVRDGVDPESIWIISYNYNILKDDETINFLYDRDPRAFFSTVVNNATSYVNPETRLQDGGAVYDMLHSKGWEASDFFQLVGRNDAMLDENARNELREYQDFDDQQLSHSDVYGPDPLRPEAQNKTAQIIHDDGYADGGEPYTDDEMDQIEKQDGPPGMSLSFYQRQGTYITSPSHTYLSDDDIDYMYAEALAQRKVSRSDGTITSKAQALNDAGVITLG